MALVMKQVTDDKKCHLDLLLLADEQESMVDRYLDRGDMFVFADGDAVVGECVVTDEGGGVCELKNIAVRPDCQRRGFGREMIEMVIRHYAGKFGTMIVGTGDVPSTVGFNKKCGFEYSHRIPGFFTDNYDHPIVEDGILLRDMVCFRRPIP